MHSTDSGLKVKLSAVVMGRVSGDELPPLVALSYRCPIKTHFIEFIPFYGDTQERGEAISVNEIFGIVAKEYNYIELVDGKHNISRKYRLMKNSEGTSGFMLIVSNTFCGGYNHIRLVSDGRMENCPFDAGEFDLLKLCRQGKGVSNLIEERVWRKRREKGGQFTEISTMGSQKMIDHSMIRIDG